MELLEHQQLKTFNCRLAHVAIGKINSYEAHGFKYEVNVEVTNTELKSAFTTK